MEGQRIYCRTLVTDKGKEDGDSFLPLSALLFVF